jgi:hypothetical protein
MVEGFGTVDGEAVGPQTVYMDKLTAYRKFRFRPRAGWQTPNNLYTEWRQFAERKPPASYVQDHYLHATDVERYKKLYGDTVWEPCLTATTYGHVAYGAGEHTAFCARDLFEEAAHHVAPQQLCTCGFWAYSTAGNIDIGATDTSWTALAAVQMWGNIVPGTKGVRAEKMQIVGVVPPVELPEDVLNPITKAWDALLLKLHIPQYESQAELLQGHPPQDMTELLKTVAPRPSTGGYRYQINPWNMSNWSIATQGYGPGLYPSPNGTSYITPHVQFHDRLCNQCGYMCRAQSESFADIELERHMLASHPNKGPAIAA